MRMYWPIMNTNNLECVKEELWDYDGYNYRRYISGMEMAIEVHRICQQKQWHGKGRMLITTVEQ